VKQVIEIDRFVGLKSFVRWRDSWRDNFILNTLFNFEPMEIFENWSEVRTLKVNFEIYIADRKATTCISANLERSLYRVCV